MAFLFVGKLAFIVETPPKIYRKYSSDLTEWNTKFILFANEKKNGMHTQLFYALSFNYRQKGKQ